MPIELAVPMYQHFENRFLSFTASTGFHLNPSVPVWDTGEDKTTRFVGSVTTHLKQIYYKKQKTHPIAVIQDCLKTKNLNRGIVKRSSYYPAFGLCVTFDELESVVEKYFRIVTEVFELDLSSLESHVSEDFEELACIVKSLSKSSFPHICISDGLNRDRYIHSFGDKRLTGNSIAFYTKDSKIDSKKTFISTIVVISVDGRKCFVEVTIKPLAIIQYLLGCDNEFLLYPNPNIPISRDSLDFRAHDCLIVCCKLFRSGLEPSNKGNSSRLFRKYLNELIAALPDLTAIELASLIAEYDALAFRPPLVSVDEVQTWVEKLSLLIHNPLNQSWRGGD